MKSPLHLNSIEQVKSPRGLRIGLSVFATLCMVVTGLVVPAGIASAAAVTVTNPWNPTDTGGGSVDAHGGGMIKVGSYYYWFGENRNSDNSFRYVSVYRSTNLREWEWRNDVLTSNSSAELNSANIERPKVIYNAATSRYVIWMHKEGADDYGEARAAVASSPTVDGDYTYHGSFRPLNHMSRDIGLYVEGDTAYMYSAADENSDMHIYKLTADFRGIAGLVANPWPDQHRESPVLFKRGSVYFMLTSGTTGWYPNQAKYATATDIAGPWTSMTNVANDNTFSSQPTYVLPIQGTSTTSYLYMGDRWAGAWDRPVNESSYVWLPISFPSNNTMSLEYSDQVNIDTATGTITTAGSTAYRITARHSGKVIDAAGDTDRSSVVQWGNNGNLNQQWHFQDAGDGYFRIVSRDNGKCLDVASGSTADGTRVLLYTCGTGDNQEFQWQSTGSYFRLVARHSGKCLDVTDASTADSAVIQQWSCHSGTNQQWSRTQG
jgi:hypothetical protein